MEKPLHAKQLSLVQTCEARIAEISSNERSIQSFDRTLGEVIATSGFKTNGVDKPLLDWALIKLDKARFPEAIVNSVFPLST